MQIYLPISVYVGKFLHIHKLSVSVSVISQIPVLSDTTGVTQSQAKSCVHDFQVYIPCGLNAFSNEKQFISHKRYLIGHLYKVFNPLKHKTFGSVCKIL